jgi:small-conductance mechanosensitive channel
MDTTPLTRTFDSQLQTNLIESAVIAVVGVLIFFGLKRVFQYLLKRANLPTLTFRPIRLTLRYAVLIVAAAMIMNVWGIKTDVLLTVLGTVFGLVAIGFVAVWSVLSNFLCTFVLILFKPFSVGDDLEIPADSVSGKVVDLTLIFTTLRNPNGEYVQIPNNMFFQKIFKRRVGRGGISLENQLHQTQPTE